MTVTRVRGSSRRRPRLQVHRVRAFDVRDVAIHRGLPVTSPARTLVDLGAVIDGEQLERVLAEARVLRLVTDRRLHAAIERARGRTGTARLRELLAEERVPALTRSSAERALRRLVAAARLPEPQFNVRVDGCEVDALWPVQRLVAEVDGYAFHGHREAFERDRRRDQQLVAGGWTVIRVTWRQLTREPVAVAVRLAQALAPAAQAGAGNVG